MTSQNQDASTLASQTVQALNGDPSNVSLTDGTSLIDNWIATLGDDSPISDDLNSLKDALADSDPDSSEISSILMSLSQQTAAASSQAGGDAQGSLQQLASALEVFGRQIA